MSLMNLTCCVDCSRPLSGTSSAASSRPGPPCVKFRAGFRREEFEEEAAVSAKPSLAPSVAVQPRVTVFSDKPEDLCCLMHAYFRYKGTNSGLTAQIRPALWGRGPEGQTFCHAMHVENTLKLNTDQGLLDSNRPGEHPGNKSYG